MKDACIHRWRVPETMDPFAKRFTREDGTRWIEGNCLRCGMRCQFRLTPYERFESHAPGIDA